MKKEYAVTVRNLKVLERASDETLCFEATVYVNGKKAALATNDGRGGMTSWYFDDRGLERDIEAWAAEQPPFDAGFEDPANPGRPLMLPVSLESLVDAAVWAEYERLQEKKADAAFRRKLKSVTPYRSLGLDYGAGAYSYLKAPAEDPRVKAHLDKKFGPGGYVLVTSRKQIMKPQKAGMEA